MPIQRGSQKVIKRYRGSQEILSSYRGGQQVYSSFSPLDLGATHWLRFREPEPFKDYGLDGSNFSLVGSPVASEGALVSGYVMSGGQSPLTPRGGWSASGWILPLGTDASTTFSNVITLSTTNTISAIAYRTSDRAATWRYRRGANAQQNPIAGALLPDWTHVAFCMEPTSGTSWRFRGYINGQEVINNVFNGGTQGSTLAATGIVMATNNSYSKSISLYNRALSAAEITKLKDAGMP